MQVMSALNFGSFPGKILFTTGYGFKNICKELKKQKLKDWLDAFIKTEYLFHPDCAGFSSKQILEIDGKEYTYNFVCLRDEFDFSDRHHAVLAHEIIHVVSYNLRDMLDIARENEAFAYTHTHILTQCYAVLRQQPTIIKKIPCS